MGYLVIAIAVAVAVAVVASGRAAAFAPVPDASRMVGARGARAARACRVAGTCTRRGAAPASAETARSVAAAALAKASSTKKSSTGMGAGQHLDASPAFQGLPSQSDRSYARLLVATAERRLGQIDSVLSGCIDRTPTGRHAAAARACLRLGAAQLLFLDSPAHAAVKETVDVFKMGGGGGGRGQRRRAPPESMVKFVNAVLRRVQREGRDVLDQHTSPLDNVSPWLVQEWTEAYGEEGAGRIAEQCLEEPPIDLSLRDIGDAERVLEDFGQGATLLPNGSIRVGGSVRGAVTSWPGYQDGSWWVQSAASTLPALGLISALKEKGREDGPCPVPLGDMHVVDMCAAPGGKTAQLLAAGFGRVTAVEASARRSRRLVENLERLRLLGGRAKVVVSEGQKWFPDAEADDGSNARPISGILLDVPCSATGTGSRRPDVLRRDSDLGNLPETQEALLSHCCNCLLGVGGIVVYATCSLLKRESEDQVQKVLSTSKGGGVVMKTLPFERGEISGFDGAIDANGWLRVTPGSLGGALGRVDGFFVARLQRIK